MDSQQNIKTSGTVKPMIASDTVVYEIATMMDHNAINKLQNMQTEMMQKLTEANHSFTTFNDFSTTQVEKLIRDFEKNTKMLKELKADLDSIFRRTRNIRNRLQPHLPEGMTDLTIEEGGD